MANAVIPFKTLRMGVDEALYAAAAGAINTTGAMGVFAIPPQASVYRGVLVLSLVPVGGTVTTSSFQVEISQAPQGSINGASPFGIFNKLVIATPQTLCAYSGIVLVSTAPVAIDLSGMGGNGQMRLNFTTVTLGTATGFDVYARIG
jgi:hypothetical protein